MVFYHVTHKVNLPSIMEVGLVPMTGYLAEAGMELRDAVYLFKKLDEGFQEDINGWLASVYPRKEQVLLEVSLPEEFGMYGGLKERWDWEIVCYKHIPPEYIKQIPFPE